MDVGMPAPTWLIIMLAESPANKTLPYTALIEGRLAGTKAPILSIISAFLRKIEL
jgi:hypothetical protein